MAIAIDIDLSGQLQGQLIHHHLIRIVDDPLFIEALVVVCLYLDVRNSHLLLNQMSHLMVDQEVERPHPLMRFLDGIAIAYLKQTAGSLLQSQLLPQLQ